MANLTQNGNITKRRNQSFQIVAHIKDVFFDQDEIGPIILAPQNIEIWLRRFNYSEYLGYTQADANGKFTFSFDLDNEFIDEKVQVFFKIYIGETYFEYTLDRQRFPKNRLTGQVLEGGSNEFDIYIDVPVQYFTRAPKVLDYRFRLLNLTNNAVPFTKVRFVVTNNGQEYYDFGTNVSNDQGYLKYSLELDKEKVVTGFKYRDGIKFVHTVYGDNDRILAIKESSVEGFELDGINSLVIDVPEGDALIESKAITLLSDELGIPMSGDLQNYFQLHNLLTLHDVRRIGGLRNRVELKTPAYAGDADAIRKFDAHAQFELLSKDYGFSAKVIDAGFDTVYTIARADRTYFMNSVQGTGSTDNVAALTFYRGAYAVAGLFSNKYTERLAQHWQNTEVEYDTLQDVLNKIDDKCSCDDCETSTSPFAYLVDLLGYANAHLTKTYPNGTPSPLPWYTHAKGKINITDLEFLFCQQYSKLPIECDELHHKICQYRSCIEVLQCYKAKNPPLDACLNDAFAKAEKSFITALYYALLEQAGTSFYELRDARTDADKKAELADRLRIVPVYQTQDTIDTLFILPATIANAVGPAAIAALCTTLETIFGFASVYRQPFTGTAMATPKLQLWREEYLRVKWRKDDSVGDEYSGHTKVIVDPDIIGVDDMRQPVPGNPVYDLWNRRRQFLDNRWKTFFNGASNWHKPGVENVGGLVVVAGVYNLYLKPGDNIAIYKYDASAPNGSPVSNLLNLTVVKTELNGPGDRTHIYTAEPIQYDGGFNAIDLNLYASISNINAFTQTVHIGTGLSNHFINVKPGTRVEIILDDHGNDGSYWPGALPINGGTSIPLVGTFTASNPSNGFLRYVSNPGANALLEYGNLTAITVDNSVATPENVVNKSAKAFLFGANGVTVGKPEGYDVFYPFRQLYGPATPFTFYIKTIWGEELNYATVQLNQTLAAVTNSGTYDIVNDDINSIYTIKVTGDITASFPPSTDKFVSLVVTLGSSPVDVLYRRSIKITSATLSTGDTVLAFGESISDFSALTAILATPGITVQVKYDYQALTIITDKFRTPKLDSIFTSMPIAAIFQYLDGDPLPVTLPIWNLSGAFAPAGAFPQFSACFAAAKAALDSGVDAQVTAITTAINNQLNLPVDAFKRLAELYAKYVAQQNNAANGALTQAEIDEVFNILTLAIKNRYTNTWLGEENNLQLNTLQFWKALREPKEGNLPFEEAAHHSSINPRYITQTDLPDYVAGKTAIDLWNNRVAHLEKLVERLRTINAARDTASFGALLYYAFGESFVGGTSTILPITVYTAVENLIRELRTIQTNSKNVVVDVSAPALYRIKSSLQIESQDLDNLLSILDKLQAGGIVSDEEFEKVYSILSLSMSNRNFTDPWISKENTASLRAKYWYARKAVLPKWRGSLADRRAWQDSLASRNGIPNLDPDLVSYKDIKQVTSTAFDVWSVRKTELINELATIDSTITSFGIDGGIKYALGLTDIIHFNMLQDLEEAREDIKPYLQRFQLSSAGYRRIEALRDVTWGSMVDDEKADLKNILLQCIKLRSKYPAWNTEEATALIYLSPDIFQVVQEPYAETEMVFYQQLNPWRASWRSRRNWEKKLEARQELFAKIAENIATANDTVEADVLLRYRDALVAQLGNEEQTMAERAKALSDRLLIDCSITCCQHTTRLSQAIDTLQKFIWERSVGIETPLIFKDAFNSTNHEMVVSLSADNFAEEWKWIGSYATWRSAMFVFMFPENLLLPSLRRWQSPAFIKLAADLRGDARLTPKTACLAAGEYSSYFEDVTQLEAEATCTALERINSTKCVSGNVQQYTCMFYGFAISKVSKKVYYYRRNYQGDSMNDHSFWIPVDALNANVVSILGCPVYEHDGAVALVGGGVRHIYLFAVIIEDDVEKLVCVKYNLEEQYWDTSYTELDIPENGGLSDVQVLQRKRSTEPPKVLIRNTETGELFYNYMNKLGKKWQFSDWKLVSTGSKHSGLKELRAYTEVLTDNEPDELMLGISLNSERYIYRVLGNNDEGRWRLATKGKGEFKGLVNLDNGNRHVQFFYLKDEGNNVFTKQQVVIILGSNSTLTGRKGNYPNYMATYGLQDRTANRIASFDQLDWWIMAMARFGLYTCQLSATDSSFFSSNYWVPYGVPIENDRNFHLINTFGDSDLVGGWATYRDVFQSFQYLYTYIRQKNRTAADNFRTSADYLKTHWVQDALLNPQNTQVNQEYGAALRYADDLLKRVDSVFYTSEQDEDKKELNLVNLLSSLLNFTFDSNGHVRIQPTDKNYPENHVLILGNRIDKVAEQAEFQFAGITTIAPNWGDFALLPNLPATHYALSGKVPEKGVFACKIKVASVTLKNTVELTEGAHTLGHNLGYPFPFTNKKLITPVTDLYQDSTDTSAFSFIRINEQYRMAPLMEQYLSVTEEMTSDELQLRKNQIAAYLPQNQPLAGPAVLREYFLEAYYFVPMMLGISLSQRGHYDAALKWFKTAYDFTQDNAQDRVLYEVMHLDNPNGQNAYTRPADWLLDPLNPHLVASTRSNAYFRYTVSTVAQTFFAYADSQFTLDTVESVSKAKDLYQFGMELLRGASLINQRPDVCSHRIFEVTQQLICQYPELAEYADLIERILEGIPAKYDDPAAVDDAINAVLNILTGGPGNIYQRLQAAETYVEGLQYTAAHPNVGIAVNGTFSFMGDVLTATMSVNGVVQQAIALVDAVNTDTNFTLTMATGKYGANLNGDANFNKWVSNSKQGYPREEKSGDTATVSGGTYNTDRYSRQGTQQLAVAYSMNPIEALNTISDYTMPYVPFINGMHFCVPDNPVYKYMLMSAELNLFKIRNCMNIAGMKRDLDPYAAPTDLYTGLPQISGTGQLVLPGGTVIRPTIYRYKLLVERAKQIVGIAQQIESTYFSMLVNRDNEYFSVLRAKQDLAVAKATVKLKELQVKVSNDEVDLAVLQKERSQIQVEQLDQMINDGLNQYEQQMVSMYWSVAAMQSIIAGMEFALAGADIAGSQQAGLTVNFKALELVAFASLGAIKLGAQVSEAFLQAGINVNSIQAAQKRREQQWNFEKVLAQQDIRIGAQQVKTAQDRVRVSEQDRKISELQQQNNEATVDFLSNKFTNVELYEWMSNVLGNVYRYFLMEANGLAKVAQSQLAFERQEAIQSFIQDDYWENPVDNIAIPTPGASAPDRRGLTGSARLLQDLTRLDQYAFNSDVRKLQISKTFSLRSLFPMEFQQFIETGELNFETSMEYFDLDFPGHYHRLIKKVSATVIALVPPTAGIKATLTSSGISRVVIGGNGFQSVIVRRDSERVALSGTRESTGMFEMQMENPELLNPFEATGVHTRWQFKMPKASNMFSFDTIADVLFKVDYTAQHSYDYEQQVNRELGIDYKSERGFSIRNEFADQFYELNHPNETATPYKIDITVRPFDFPANVSYVTSDDVKLYVMLKNIEPDEHPFEPQAGQVNVIPITFTAGNPNNGGAATVQANFALNKKGIAVTSDLTGIEPTGNWKFDFTNLRTLIDEDKIMDIILVIAYSGELPERV